MSAQIQPLDATLTTTIISKGAAHTSVSRGQSLHLRSVKTFWEVSAYMQKHPKELWKPLHCLILFTKDLAWITSPFS